jgi:hypothetical protein
MEGDVPAGPRVLDSLRDYSAAALPLPYLSPRRAGRGSGLPLSHNYPAAAWSSFGRLASSDCSVISVE